MTWVQAPAGAGIIMINIKTDKFTGKRADFVLRNMLVGAKLSFIFSLFRKKRVFVNGKPVENKYRINTGDNVEIDISNSQFNSLQKMQKHFEVLFEDKHILIINKQAGLAVHGGEGIKWSLINELQDYLHTTKSDLLVNRIDKNTSGIVLIAKDNETLSKLSLMIEHKEVEKYYLALVKGKFRKKEGLISSKLETIRNKTFVSETGKKAETGYKVVKEFENYSLVELRLLTGRTHQIRAHLLSVGCPVVGDKVYGVDELTDRQFLHSYKIIFTHPYTGNTVEAVAELPDDLKKVIDKLK